MMTRPLGWTLIGLIGGLLLAPSIGHLMAGHLMAQQQRPATPPAAQEPARLIFTPATSSMKSMGQLAYFIKDTKSGACWLGVGSAMAVAPAAACP